MTRAGPGRQTLAILLVACVAAVALLGAWTVDRPRTPESETLVARARDAYANDPGSLVALTALAPRGSWRTMYAFPPGTPRWRVYVASGVQDHRVPGVVPADDGLLVFARGTALVTELEVPRRALDLTCLASLVPNGMTSGDAIRVVPVGGGADGLAAVPAAGSAPGAGACVRRLGAG